MQNERILPFHCPWQQVLHRSVCMVLLYGSNHAAEFTTTWPWALSPVQLFSHVMTLGHSSTQSYFKRELGRSLQNVQAKIEHRKALDSSEDSACLSPPGHFLSGLKRGMSLDVRVPIALFFSLTLHLNGISFLLILSYHSQTFSATYGLTLRVVKHWTLHFHTYFQLPHDKH